jgi:hypothetical protein
MKQKLIDQLLHKAGARFGAEGTDYSDFASAKFAELIVIECAGRVEHILRERQAGGGTMGDDIREHFGVKQ